MLHNAENDATRHRPECWCNGTGFRVDLGVPCNLPQLSDAEHAYVIPPARCLDCGSTDLHEGPNDPPPWCCCRACGSCNIGGSAP